MQRRRQIDHWLLVAAACAWALSPTHLLASEGLRPYETHGTVLGIRAEDGYILIDHDPIVGPGFFMAKMEMAFSVADPALMKGLTKGDRIRFRVSEEKRSRIIELHKVTK